MLKDIDNELKKVLLIKYEKIAIIITWLIYIIICFFIPKNWIIILIWFISPGIVFLAFMFPIYIKEHKKTKEMKAEEIIRILLKYNINNIDKIKAIMNENKTRIQKPNFINIASFLLLILSTIISIIHNLQDYESAIIFIIVEILSIALAYVLYYKILSNQEYYEELNKYLLYLLINYENYFPTENNEKKSSIVKDVLLYAINKIFK